MLIRFNSLLLAASLLTTLPAWCNDGRVSPAKNVAAEERAIQQLLDAYGATLNASDAERLTSLYTREAEVVAPGLPTAAGSAQIRKTYEGIAKAIKLQLRFTPAQIVVASMEHAYATSTSSGPVTVLATGQMTVNNYREL